MLVYAATASRLGAQTEEIMLCISNQGLAGLHPFNALPYRHFEGGAVGRQQTLEYCLRLIDISDEFWLFGISEGTLLELKHFVSSRADAAERFRDLTGIFDREAHIYRQSLGSIFSKEFEWLDSQAVANSAKTLTLLG
jgi:hypothetical protein